MNKYIIPAAIIATFALIGAGCVKSQVSNSNQETTYEVLEDEIMIPDEASEDEDSENEAMMDEETNEDEAMMEDEAQNPGTYVAYDAGQIAQAATDGTAILFFHAPWCPTCSALNKDIEAHVNDIPAGVTIFKTDYDTNTELRQKYGVTYQHTLVVVDANGNQLDKWSGGNTLDSILERVN